MARNADETRGRLLQAATAEFAAHGIAGARVDRIAAAATANKSLLYAYFGNKDSLFDAVFNELVTRTLSEVPITADDLPGYTARLFDHYLGCPELLRLSLWDQLERDGAGLALPVVTAANAEKIAAIAQAQRDGTVSDHLPAEDLLGMLVSIATAAALSLPAPHVVTTARTTARRHAIMRAAASLTHEPAT